MKRTHFTPETGKTYRNAGGGTFRCLSVLLTPGRAIMQNVASGWTFTAVGCGRYENDTIDWDYSVGGYFREVTA